MLRLSSYAALSLIAVVMLTGHANAQALPQFYCDGVHNDSAAMEAAQTHRAFLDVDGHKRQIKGDAISLSDLCSHRGKAIFLGSTFRAPAPDPCDMHNDYNGELDARSWVCHLPTPNPKRK